jgi:hypothetical protein
VKKRPVIGDEYPPYPNLGATVAKLRRSDDRRAHGEAVIEAIRKLQAAELNRAGGTTPSIKCASGTTLHDGAAIIKAVREQNRKAFEAACERDRHGRSDDLIRVLYEQAMASKRRTT